MRGEIFKKNIRGYNFSFEKLMLTNNETLFFVTSNMPGERSFFISLINGRWQILYHNILGREVLSMELQFAEALKEEGY
ncbi:MAG: hypothetical protein JNK00_03920 [Flavipsychrobacter sp.]|nr:hypothetical protein [Flavipsychrobacter sp.]